MSECIKSNVQPEVLNITSSPDEAVNAAMYSLEDNGVDFAEICVERLERTTDAIPNDPKEKQKLIASLVRYGFSTSQIRDAIKELNK